jgi:translation initiation factor 1
VNSQSLASWLFVVAFVFILFPFFGPSGSDLGPSTLRKRFKFFSVGGRKLLDCSVLSRLKTFKFVLGGGALNQLKLALSLRSHARRGMVLPEKRMTEKFGYNPFADLPSDHLPPGAETTPHPEQKTRETAPRKSRGRVDIIRQKAGRGGKTVTVVKGFVGIGLPEKEGLARAMQKACGVGGTVKDGQIEIQGDKREEVARILTEANFRPVFAGG